MLCFILILVLFNNICLILIEGAVMSLCIGELKPFGNLAAVCIRLVGTGQAFEPDHFLFEVYLEKWLKRLHIM